MRMRFIAGAVIGSLGFGVVTAAEDNSSASGLQEIVVTAQKREQNLNDVGLAVAVLSGDALRDRQITDMSQLANAVPGLSYTESAFSTPVYTIRGVGFYENSIAAYPAVTTYMDEVPLTFPTMSRHTTYDIERVEVLKGPQGTLFGQNATGGAINFIAAKPTRDLHAGAELTYGRFNERDLEAYVSGALTDNVQGRFSARMEARDGWQESNTRPDDRNGGMHNYMARGQLAYEPTDRLVVHFNLSGWLDRGETQAPQYVGFYPQIPGVVPPAIVANSFSPNDARAADWTPGIPFDANRFWQASARIDYEASDDITLTSISAYSDYAQNQAEDQDGLPQSNLDIVQDRGRIKSIFEELRAANAGTNRYRWVAGLNVESTKTKQLLSSRFPDASSAIAYGALGFTGIAQTGNDYSSAESLQNYAGFGNMEADIGHFTLKLGARFTEARQQISSCNSDQSLDGIGALLHDAVLGGAYGPYVPGSCFPINSLGVDYGGVPAGAPGPFRGELNQSNVSWRTGVDWKPFERTLVYLNVAKGFKAGSFPTLASSTFKQTLPVTQESVLSVEGGIKSSLLNNRLQVNAAAFFYDYKDKQIRAKLVDPVFGVLDALQNIPKSSVRGFELETPMKPMRGLTITPNFTYIDAKINDFTGINGAGVSQDFAGTRIPYTPKFQSSLDGNFERDISGDLKAFVGTSVNYRSNTVAVIGGDVNPAVASPQNTTLFGLKAYSTVDVRLGLAAVDNTWRLSLWGKNVFNTYYWNNVSTISDTIVRYAGQPATFGVSVSYNH